MLYTVSETYNGRYIVQRPNGLGGLYPLITFRDDCRSIAEIFAKIAVEALNNYPESIEVEFRTESDPANSFTQ